MATPREAPAESKAGAAYAQKRSAESVVGTLLI